MKPRKPYHPRRQKIRHWNPAVNPISRLPNCQEWCCTRLRTRQDQDPAARPAMTLVRDLCIQSIDRCRLRYSVPRYRIGP